MKIILLNIFNNKITPDENFPDYGITSVDEDGTGNYCYCIVKSHKTNKVSVGCVNLKGTH